MDYWRRVHLIPVALVLFAAIVWSPQVFEAFTLAFVRAVTAIQSRLRNSAVRKLSHYLAGRRQLGLEQIAATSSASSCCLYFPQCYSMDW